MTAIRPCTCLVLAVLVQGCATLLPDRAAPATTWVELFDGATLAGFEPSGFAGAGTATVDDGILTLAAGSPFSGITCTRPVPRTGYELQVEAARLEGRDFFAAITFPVGARFCTLILGGWGGQLVGLSSLDDADASENDTSCSLEFDRGRYYQITIRVTPDQIQARVDDETIVDADIRERKVGIRWELEPSRPLGIATYRTRAGYRKIRFRLLSDLPSR